MGGYYYNRSRRKKTKNSKGKILVLSHLESLKADDLKTQKTIYTEELQKVNNFFEGNEFLSKKKECDNNFNKLKPLLNELLEESKSLGDEAFYHTKKTYFVKKKLFSKNYISLHIRRYANDESKGFKFLEIAESIASICDEIKEYSEYCKDIYGEVEKILREHNVWEYPDKDEKMHSLINNKNNNFNLEDKKILSIYKGRYSDTNWYDETEYEKISKGFSEFFINSMNDGTDNYNDWADWVLKQRVNYEPASAPDDIVYYNESNFMKKFLEISERFEIPWEVYRPTINHKKKVIEVLERFIRKIELIERASIKQKEKSQNLGYVYVLSNQAYPNIYKIGSTYSLPEERAEELTGTGNLYPFKVEKTMKIKDAEYYEKKIHSLLEDKRITKNREFFEIDLDVIEKFFNKVSVDINRNASRLKLDDLKRYLND